MSFLALNVVNNESSEDESDNNAVPDQHGTEGYFE